MTRGAPPASKMPQDTQSARGRAGSWTLISPHCQLASILLAGWAFPRWTLCGECFYRPSRHGFQEQHFNAVLSSLLLHPAISSWTEVKKKKKCCRICLSRKIILLFNKGEQERFNSSILFSTEFGGQKKKKKQVFFSLQLCRHPLKCLRGKKMWSFVLLKKSRRITEVVVGLWYCISQQHSTYWDPLC